MNSTRFFLINVVMQNTHSTILVFWNAKYKFGTKVPYEFGIKLPYPSKKQRRGRGLRAYFKSEYFWEL